MQPNVDISDVLRRGFNLYKENITTLLIATLVATLISAFTVGLLAGPMMAGLALVTLGLIDRAKPKPQVGDIFKGFEVFVQSLVFFVLLVVATMVGQFILGFIPILGPLLSALYSFALNTAVLFTIFYIAEKKMDAVAAIQKSLDVVKTNFWIFLALAIIAGVVSSLGVIACGIGIFVTLPMYICTIATVYRDLHPVTPASN